MANGMDSAVELLKDLISSPDAGEKISSLISSLQSDSSDKKSNSLDLSSIANILSSSDSEKGSDNTNNTAALDTLPIANIMKITKEYQNLANADDPRINLLKALRPYLQPHRIGNLENAIKILGLVKLMPLLGKLKDII